MRAGLPPTPIASPYLWSLRAALEPADTPYFYYVLCGDDGGHRFAVTYDEHLANVDVCLWLIRPAAHRRRTPTSSA